MSPVLFLSNLKTHLVEGVRIVLLLQVRKLRSERWHSLPKLHKISASAQAVRTAASVHVRMVDQVTHIGRLCPGLCRRKKTNSAIFFQTLGKGRNKLHKITGQKLRPLDRTLSYEFLRKSRAGWCPVGENWSLDLFVYLF